MKRYIIISLILLTSLYSQRYIYKQLDDGGFYQYNRETNEQRMIIPDTLENDYSVLWGGDDDKVMMYTENLDYDRYVLYLMQTDDFESRKILFEMERYDAVIQIFDAPKRDRIVMTISWGYSAVEKSYTIDRTNFTILDTIPPIGLHEFEFPQERVIVSEDQTKIYRLNQGKDHIEFRSISLETGEVLESNIVIESMETIKVNEGQTAYHYEINKGCVLLSFTSLSDSKYKIALVDPEKCKCYAIIEGYSTFRGNTFLSKDNEEIIRTGFFKIQNKNYYQMGTIFVFNSKDGNFKQLIKFPSFISEDYESRKGVYFTNYSPDTLFYYLEDMSPDMDNYLTANLDYIQPADSICSTMLDVVTEYNKPEVKLIPDNDVYDSIVRMIKDAREYLRDDNTTSAKWMLEYFLVYLEAVNTMDASQYSSYQQAFSQEMIELKSTLNKGQPATTIISKMQERITGQALQKSTSSSDSDKVLSDRAKNSLTYISQKILDERL